MSGTDDKLVGLPVVARIMKHPGVTVTSLLKAIEDGRLAAQDDPERPGRKLVSVADVKRMLEGPEPRNDEPLPDSPDTPKGRKKFRLRK